MRILFLLFSFLFTLSIYSQQQVGSTLEGKSVGISSNGQRIVVGSPDKSVNGAFIPPGAVEVYDLVGEDWVQAGQSIIGEGLDPDMGTAVDITADGNRIAVCEAHIDDPVGNVKVFDWINGAWGQVGGDIRNPSTGSFAYNVSMTPSGNRVIVNGKYSNNTAYITVFEFANGDWELVGSIIDAPLLDFFNGRYGDIDISGTGDRIVIGNPSRIDQLGPAISLNKGFVYVYDLKNGIWELTSTIESDISNTGFGWSVSITADGNRLAIGEPKGHSEVCSTNFRPGKVNVYDWTGTEWVFATELTGVGCGEDNVGIAVDISAEGDFVAIGAIGRRDQRNNAGKILRYKDGQSNGQWVLDGVEKRGESSNEQFGDAIALSGDGEYVVAANFNNHNIDTKVVRVFNHFFEIELFEGGAACIGLDNGIIRIISRGLSNSCSYSFLLIYQDGSVASSGPFVEDNFSIENLAEGNYTFIIFDEGGLVVEEYPIEVNGIIGSVFEILTITTGNSVNDLPVGKIDITISGGTPDFNINWSGPVSGSLTTSDDTFELSNLISGVYTITITDFLGNAIIQDVSIINESAPVEACDSPLDIIILNDVSGSVDAVEYEESKAFFVNFCNALNIGEGLDDSRVAIAEFSDTENQEIRIPTTGSLENLQNYSSSSRNFEGGTNPNAALTFGYNYLEANARPDATKILVLSTDATSDQVSPALIALSKEYQAQGYIIVTIAFDEAFRDSYTLSILQQTATASSLAPGADAYSNLTESLAEYIVNVYVCGFDSGGSNTFNFSRDGLIEIIDYSLNGDCDDFESIELEISITAEQQLALPAGTPISFYFNNPEIFSATPIITSFLPCALQPGDTEIIIVTIPVSGPSEIWVVLNDNLSQQPPITLPTTDIDESIYINNLDFISVCVDEVPTVSVLKYTTTPIPVCGNTVFYTVDICNISQYDLVEVVAEDRAPFNFALQNILINNNGCTEGENPFDIPVGCCVSLNYEYDASLAAFGLYDNQGFDLYGPGNQVYISYDGLSSTNEDVLIGEVDCPSDIVELKVTPKYTEVCDDQFNICEFEITNTTNVPLQSVLFQAVITEPVIWASEPYSINSMSINNSSITETHSASFIIDEIPPFSTGKFSIAMYLEDWDASGSFEIEATLSQLPSFINGMGDNINITSPTIFVNAGPTIITDSKVGAMEGEVVYLEATLINGQNPIWISAGDGTFDDPNSLTPIYTPGPVDIINELVSISLSVENTVADCSDDLAVIFLDITSCTDISPTKETLTYCDGEVVTIFGEEIEEAGIYESEFTASNGCDSIHQIELILNPSYLDERNLEFCQGDTAFVLGQEITNNQIVFSKFFTQNGCDSIEQINVIFVDSIYTAEIFEFCEGETPVVFGTPQSEEGTYVSTFSAENGCDSVHQITLVKNIPKETMEIITICEEESVVIFGVEETAEGTYSGQFVASNNCDSIHIVELNINKNIQTFETITICEGDSIDIFGNIERESGDFEYSYTAFNNCDSIHNVSLQITETINTAETIMLCEGEEAVVFGNIESEAGLYNESFIGVNNCDSIHQINLIINKIIETSETLTICEGDTIVIFGVKETEAGIFNMQENSINGCDSTHQIILEVNQSIETFEILSLCDGDSLDVFGIVETSSGIFSNQFTGSNNCDSTHQIELIMLENIVTIDTLSICEGEEISIFENIETEAGLYESQYYSINNCDSTHQTILIVDSVIYTNENIELCEGESALVFGSEVFENNSSEATFSSVTGCDSVHTVNVMFIEEFEILSFVTLCADEVTTFFGDTITLSGTYFYNASSLNGACDSSYILEVETLEPIEYMLPTSIEVNEGKQFLLPLSSVDNNLNYNWSPAENLSCSDCEKPYTTLTENQVFSVLITDQWGCQVTSQINVNVLESLNIYCPNAFSPNDDNRNDYFNVFSNDENLEIQEIQVFDRWGGLVYESNNLSPNETNNGWDGKFKGEPMSEGIYVYRLVIKESNGSEIFKSGDLLLIR